MFLINKKVQLAEWSIKVFKSNMVGIAKLNECKFERPTIQAKDISDVPAEFVADPFILQQNKKFYMFFEVLNKQSERGEIGLATSNDGEEWIYQKIVLKEPYHLSYPHVIKYNDHFYMFPESVEAQGVFLYKSKNFPYEWEKVSRVISGQYIDPTLFEYNNKWWMFVGSLGGNLHLFYADHLNGNWVEHPKSPLITENNNISRPAGRVVVYNGQLYRFAQDSIPYYGRLVRSFKISEISESEYKENEVQVILSGSDKEGDWRKDGMHHIEQLKINDGQWIVAVDGHIFNSENYFKWKFKRLMYKLIQ
jgi:hypothetical protein